ncbi:MAG: hypothetical protein HC838_03500 [Spirulinaceae cyanobacterium RM2_2_10]|nr:hypothetical protein [Spirulinaceae cyanobacterium RM2_2_10]
MLLHRQPHQPLVRLAGVAIASLISLSMVQPSSAQPLCDTGEAYEPAATTQRTVDLPQFGLTIQIPSNYRTWQRQDGTVEILHPQTYDFVRCVAAGGLGGRGYYAESIREVARDRQRSLYQSALDLGGAGSTVEPYTSEWFSGYLVQSDIGYHVAFVFARPERPNDFLVVAATCDCQIEVEAVTDLIAQMAWRSQPRF